MILVLMLLGASGYYQYSAKTHASVKPAAAQAAPAQASNEMSAADQAYLTDYMKRTGANYRAYREGVTDQNLSLPSGKRMKMRITKTGTGWCPIRHEKLYQTSIAVSSE